jgi:hypothetical protein
MSLRTVAFEGVHGWPLMSGSEQAFPSLFEGINRGNSTFQNGRNCECNTGGDCSPAMARVRGFHGIAPDALWLMA